VQIAALLFGSAVPLAAQCGVIPVPARIISGEGFFTVDSSTQLRVPPGDRGAAEAARYLAELWNRTNGIAVTVAAGAPHGHSIDFGHRDGFGAEGYAIEVTPQRISVSASSAAGLYYGAITLWQLLPPGGRTGEIPAQTIHDAPAYRWRGLMLDSARHFQSPAFIRSMIDWMAWHKLNVLHWHLTDDQGWRLEIRKYPRLTSVGAWRIDPDGTRYGGFYTQDEVRDIVRFAAAHHVEIVPEIDMPGHATAAIAAYPHLGSALPAGAPPAVSASWGILDHLFNLQPQTFGFLDDVLSEVMQLFPGRYVHIGGDEAVKDEWNASPSVQARARQLGIHDAGALQAYFTQRMGRFVQLHGRRIVGWDEILQPGLEKDAVVMSWHGVAGAHAAALAGHDAILTPWPTLYLDNRQSTLASEPPGRLKVISLEDVYRFEPRDPTLSAAQQDHVRGIQANLWTEHMRTEARVEWMALPRAAALAEVAWSPSDRRRWPDFLERLVPMFARYRAFGLNCADSVFSPIPAVAAAPEGFRLTLSTQAGSDPKAPGDIRYTLDGSAPAAQSARYGAPLSLPAGSEVRAATFVGSAQVSRAWTGHFDARTLLRRDSHELEPCSDAIGLLLEPAGASAPLSIDIMNPCWIDRGVDLTAGPRLVAGVAPLPFNYEIGADAAKIRVGDSRTAEGELEIHADGCDTPVIAALPLAPALPLATPLLSKGVSLLPAQRLPALPGRHDLCLRFARPRLDPMWALDSVEFEE
jgi:hexosaminidase